MRTRDGLVLGLWLALVGTAQGLLLDHSTTAGDPGQPLPTLPHELAERLGAEPGHPLLLLAAHPMCPCLPASLGELERVLAGADVPLRVLLHTPSAVPSEWDASTERRVRARLPSQVVCDDRDGALAQQFGLATSGHVLLYDACGRLRFRGGITAGRGHTGDNSAQRRLAAELGDLAHAGKPLVTTAVFGCPLRADSDAHDCCQPR